MKNKNKKVEEVNEIHTIKAYDNRSFIHSSDGRIIRIIAEYLYPEQRLRRQGIKKTIIFFGSARLQPKEKYLSEIQELEAKLPEVSDYNKAKIKGKIQHLQKRMEIVARYYDEAYELAKMIGEWSKKFSPRNTFYVCTGGGPGIMEAANRGAHDAGVKTIGLNISLPFEQLPNPYITKELNFEFHYFFMRKFWLVYPSQVLIVFPGGFGTIDEMMEILTLRQTGKLKTPKLIILYSSDYWQKVINFDFLVEMGMISKGDLKIFHFANSPNDAFNLIRKSLDPEYKS
ncbi:MAG: LOG family protein [Candidatus Kapaibacteriales bacterium]